MFVERCQYSLYYKSYVDLSTTTLITLGLEMLPFTRHGALRKMRAGTWRSSGSEGGRERTRCARQQHFDVYPRDTRRVSAGY